MSEEPKTFTPGQIVKLRSGSPSLTVVTSDQKCTLVTWIGEDERVQEHAFSTHCLKEY